MIYARSLRQGFIALLLSTFSSLLCATETLGLFPITDTASLSRAQEFYQIYQTSVQLINPEISDRFNLETPQGISQTADSVATDSVIVKRLGLEGKTTGTLDDENLFESFVLPEVLKYHIKYSQSPTTPTLERFFHLNVQHYPQQEWVEGQDIHVKSVDWGNETTAVAGRIKQQLQTEPFPKVAFLYNESVGVKSDGRLGRVMRGQIPDWKFDLLMQAKPGVVFGPVPVEDGWYFGKVDDRLTSDASPFEYYSNQVLQDYRRVFAQEHLKQLLAEAQQRVKPDVHAYDVRNALGPAQVAYVIEGTTVTFEQCKKRLPFLVGDVRSPLYWDSMSSQSLQNHLLVTCDEARQLRDSPEFHYLQSAHRNARLIEQYVQKQLRELPEGADALEAFYREQCKSPRYMQPDMVKLLVARIPDIAGTHGRPNRALMNRIRQDFEASPTTETLARLQQTAPGLTYRADDAPGSIDNLGRVLEMAIGKGETGFLTPVFVGPDGACYFAKVLLRVHGQPKPLGEVKEQLKVELHEQRRQQLLKSLYDGKSTPAN